PHNRDYASISFHNAEELEIFGVVIFSIKAHK
ncbi:TPA: DNA polymerase V subunit UmuD, partial [Klebsiella variicola subsp. variicola]